MRSALRKRKQKNADRERKSSRRHESHAVLTPEVLSRVSAHSSRLTWSCARSLHDSTPPRGTPLTRHEQPSLARGGKPVAHAQTLPVSAHARHLRGSEAVVDPLGERLCPYTLRNTTRRDSLKRCGSYAGAPREDETAQEGAAAALPGVAAAACSLRLLGGAHCCGRGGGRCERDAAVAQGGRARDKRQARTSRSWHAAATASAAAAAAM